MNPPGSFFQSLLAVAVLALTAISAAQAEASVPQIQIEATFVEMPEAVWKPMAGTGSWQVVRGQRVWTRLIVSTDRHEQEALIGAWFGSKERSRSEAFLALVQRELHQTKGVDVLSTPKVVTRSGQRAMIEIVREFKYPTAWKPGAKKEDAWMPTAHAAKHTGVTLAVEPSVLRGGKIGLWVAPQILEFEGFQDLGHGRKKPIFSERKVRTNVALKSGQTVILDGGVREEQQVVEDRVPLLGNLPVLGRLFRTSQKQTSKRSLVVFVTPRILPLEGKLPAPPTAARMPRGTGN